MNLERGIAVVFGKTRERQPIPLTDGVVESLERYRTVLDPANEGWPVFPTRHHASIAKAAREGLDAHGWNTGDIEATLEDATSMEVLREHEIAPPVLSKNGARSLMKRLYETAAIDIDGEYLKPQVVEEGLEANSTHGTPNSYRNFSATSRSRPLISPTASRTSSNSEHDWRNF